MAIQVDDIFILTCDGVKVIAANIDQILMVSAVLPEFTPSIIDRYLIFSVLPLLAYNLGLNVGFAYKKALARRLMLI